MEGNALLLDKRSPESALLWKFNVPRDGIYYLFGLWQTDGIERNLFEFSVDGDKADVHRNPGMELPQACAVIEEKKTVEMDKDGLLSLLDRPYIQPSLFG